MPAIKTENWPSSIVHRRRLNKYDRRLSGIAIERDSLNVDRPQVEPLIKVVGRFATDVEVRDSLSHIDWDSDLFDFPNDGEIAKYVQAQGVTPHLGGESQGTTKKGGKK